MSTGFYPGCSLTGSSREYSESLLAVARELGLAIPEVPDWNCCGATAAHNIDPELALTLPARILAHAEQAGMKEVLVPCAACYSRLQTTRHHLRADPDLLARISGRLQMEFHCEIDVINILQWLEREVIPLLAAKKLSSLGYQAACYYGCLLVRPPRILGFDRPEDPRIMDRIVAAIGLRPIEWAFKTECCGAGFSISRTDIVARLSGKILEDAQSRGAELVVVACPMCHTNLDMRRGAIERQAGKKYRLPVLYITQAVGLALGISPRKLGLNRHFVPVSLRAPAGEN